MEQQGEERRLTTILSADVVGYGRLMGEDEAGTLAALKKHRKELFEPKASQYRGRVVKLMGDGTLMEFGSVVDAVRFAIEVQHAMRERNAEISEEMRIEFRIGINVGDIIVEGDDIYGDGVNIAARLEALSEPGGICVRRNVRNQVRDKIDINFRDLGEIEVKNIARPIRVFGVVLDDKAGALVTPVIEEAARPQNRHWARAAAAAGVLLVIGGALWWQPWQSTPESNLVVPSDRPSIAVLPFDNVSGEPEQEYFSDGISEDIITDLSKISGLLVIARHSSFRFKGEAIDIREIARQLGVRYVLEGSVRKADSQVRINAQLIDASTGGHLWAERYDRPLDDIFAVQDEITQQIVAALHIELTRAERERVVSRYTSNLEAYDLFLLARSFRSDLTRERNEQARQLLEQAIELDPNFAAAYAELSWVHHMAWTSQWGGKPEAIFEIGLEMAQKAVALDDSLPEAHGRLAFFELSRHRFEQAIAEGERAIALDPNYADGYLLLGHTYIYAGRPEDGIRVAKEGMPLDPDSMYHNLMHLADGQWMLGQDEEAIANLKRSVELRPDFMVGYLWQAAINGDLGREGAASAAAQQVLRLSPEFSIAAHRKKLQYKDQAVIERFVEGLRRAGLPE